MEIAASVVGLAVAAAQTFAVLHNFASNCADAPSIAKQTRGEIQEFQYVLGKLQTYTSPSDPNNPLRPPIAVADAHQLSLTLEACNETFVELDKTITRLAPILPIDSVQRMKWSFAQGNITHLVQRIQNHKASLILILSILQKYVRDSCPWHQPAVVLKS